MNLADFFECFFNIVDSWCTSVEVDSDRVLTSIDIDNGWGLSKQSRVSCEIGDSDCRRHDNQLQRLDRRILFLAHLTSSSDHSTQKANEYIGIDTSLVRFVNYDCGIFGQQQV